MCSRGEKRWQIGILGAVQFIKVDSYGVRFSSISNFKVGNYSQEQFVTAALPRQDVMRPAGARAYHFPSALGGRSVEIVHRIFTI